MKCGNLSNKATKHYLFEDTISTLESILQQYPSACIAAITNGKGNSLLMSNTMTPFFDFCVSGEDNIIFPNHKPLAGIYHVALKKDWALHPHHKENSQV